MTLNLDVYLDVVQQFMYSFSLDEELIARFLLSGRESFFALKTCIHKVSLVEFGQANSCRLYYFPNSLLQDIFAEYDNIPMIMTNLKHPYMRQIIRWALSSIEGVWMNGSGPLPADITSVILKNPNFGKLTLEVVDSPTAKLFLKSRKFDFISMGSRVFGILDDIRIEANELKLHNLSLEIVLRAKLIKTKSLIVEYEVEDFDSLVTMNISSNFQSLENLELLIDDTNLFLHPQKILKFLDFTDEKFVNLKFLNLEFNECDDSFIYEAYEDFNMLPKFSEIFANYENKLFDYNGKVDVEISHFIKAELILFPTEESARDFCKWVKKEFEDFSCLVEASDNVIYHTLHKSTKVTEHLEIVTSILNIIDILYNQPIDALTSYGKLRERDSTEVKPYLLWYPCTIPNLIAKATTNFTYQSPSMFVKSMEAEELCKNAEDETELCFDGTNQVSSPSETSICSKIVLSDNVCKQNVNRFYISMSSAKFYTFGCSNTMNLDMVANVNYSELTTSETVDRCKCGNVLQSSHVVATGGLDTNGSSTSYNPIITLHHSKAVNDLHRQPYIGQFIQNSLQKGLRMSRLAGSYQQTCNSTYCVIIYEGCSSDPIVCSTGVHIAAGILFGVSIIIVVYFIGVSEIKNARIFFRCMPNWFQNVFIFHRDGRLRRFSFLYSIVVLIFNSFVLFLGDRQVFQNDTSCEIMAGVHYFLFLSIFFILMESIFTLTNAVGGWKTWYRFMIFILSGLDKQVVRGVYSFIMPFFLTGIFGLTMVDFFKRNDDFCWIRSDYKFPSLWLPLILFIISFIFYIPLIARSYRNNVISRSINHIFAENGKHCGPISIDGDEKKSGNYLVSGVISWLFVPQFILVLSMIFETKTLYVTELGSWHLLFIIFIYVQITFYYTVSFIVVVLFGGLNSNQEQYDNYHNPESDSSTNQQTSAPKNESEPTVASPPQVPSHRRISHHQNPHLTEKNRKSQTSKTHL